MYRNYHDQLRGYTKEHIHSTGSMSIKIWPFWRHIKTVLLVRFRTLRQLTGQIATRHIQSQRAQHQVFKRTDGLNGSNYRHASRTQALPVETSQHTNGSQESSTSLCRRKVIWKIPEVLGHMSSKLETDKAVVNTETSQTSCRLTVTVEHKPTMLQRNLGVFTIESVLDMIDTMRSCELVTTMVVSSDRASRRDMGVNTVLLKDGELVSKTRRSRSMMLTTEMSFTFT